MKPFCLIPARGGSKRIPRKNAKSFLGVPLIRRTVEKACESQTFSEVVVSTDDDEIADLSLDAGAHRIFRRSEETANDMATTAEVVDEYLRQSVDDCPSIRTGCCLYPTAVLISVRRIKEAIVKMDDPRVDGVVTVQRYLEPIQRALRIQDGKLAWQWPEFAHKRSQDLEALFMDAGQFYFFNVEAFKNNQSLILSSSVPLILDSYEAQDIDTLEDWKAAEMKFEHNRNVGIMT